MMITTWLCPPCATWGACQHVLGPYGPCWWVGGCFFLQGQQSLAVLDGMNSLWNGCGGGLCVCVRSNRSCPFRPPQQRQRKEGHLVLMCIFGDLGWDVLQHACERDLRGAGGFYKGAHTPRTHTLYKTHTHNRAHTQDIDAPQRYSCVPHCHTVCAPLSSPTHLWRCGGGLTGFILRAAARFWGVVQDGFLEQHTHLYVLTLCMNV